MGFILKTNTDVQLDWKLKKAIKLSQNRPTKIEPNQPQNVWFDLVFHFKFNQFNFYHIYKIDYISLIHFFTQKPMESALFTINIII